MDDGIEENYSEHCEQNPARVATAERRESQTSQGHLLAATPLEIQVPISSFSYDPTGLTADRASVSKIGKSDFIIASVIGKGAYGKVFLVKKTTGPDSGNYYAMKVLRKAHIILHSKDTEHTKTERAILEEVRHPFIVRLFYAFQTDSKLYLILDYASGGELFMYLDQQKMFLEDTSKFYLAELVLALEHLHKLGIIYRDLKPENVLLDHTGHVKLTDFGLSKVALDEDSRANTICGTIEYMAPEVLNGTDSSYDKTVDWWSLGALGFDMMTGNPPFTSNNRRKTIDLILNKRLALPNFLSVDAKDFLTRLLKKRPNARLGYGNEGSSDVKSHRFFRGTVWESLGTQIPPIKPKITSPDDVGNFHQSFTSMDATDSPSVRESNMQPNDEFSGFSFVAKSVFSK